MLLSFLKFPLPVLRHRIFFHVSARFSFVYARRLVEEGVRQNPAFVQNGENVAKTGKIGGIVSPYRKFQQRNQLRIGYQITKINTTTRGKTTPSRKSTPSILAIIFSIYILLLFTIVHTSIYHFSLSECIRQVLFYCSKLANRAHAWLRLVSLTPIHIKKCMGVRCPQAFAWGRELIKIYHYFLDE